MAAHEKENAGVTQEPNDSRVIGQTLHRQLHVGAGQFLAEERIESAGISSKNEQAQRSDLL